MQTTLPGEEADIRKHYLEAEPRWGAKTVWALTVGKILQRRSVRTKVYHPLTSWLGYRAER